MKPFAIFTIVRDESLFLRMWLNYYGRWSSEADLFLLDDSSSDGSVEDAVRRNPGLSVRTVDPGRRYDLSRLRTAVQSFQQELLRGYEAVVYSDVDEFLLPRHGTLLDYLQRFRADGSRQVARSTGWHCVQREGEPPSVVAPGESALNGRDSLWRLPNYDKTLVSKVPLSWTNGFHACSSPEQVDPDPDLCLFHAWMLDEQIFLSKRRDYVRVSWKQLVSKYTTSPGSSRPFPIPEEWRSLLVW